MKNKKTNHDKIIEAIEQDTLDEVYETLKEGLYYNKHIAVLRKISANEDKYKNVNFAKITSICNGFELKNISDGNKSTIIKLWKINEEGNAEQSGPLITDGFLIRDLINNRTENTIHGKNDVMYIDVISEQEYLEIKLEDRFNNINERINSIKYEDLKRIKENVGEDIEMLHRRYERLFDNIIEIEEKQEKQAIIFTLILIFVVGLQIISFLINNFLTK